ncbi:hypothetical protein M1494_01370 [Candidatus Parvarchaeota archaeon]|nr:hypothetical protein [Candidatus Parvarchaeota archaeon]
MLGKNINKAFKGLDKLRKNLDVILDDLNNEDPEKILKFPYNDLSDYFKNIKIELVRKRKEDSKFPGKSSDYIIKSGSVSDYGSNAMNDSVPLFYMSGVYRTRYPDLEREYFGVKVNGNVRPAAYIKPLNSGDYKVYLNYDVIKDLDKESFKKLVAATSIRLSDYKSASYFR